MLYNHGIVIVSVPFFLWDKLFADIHNFKLYTWSRILFLMISSMLVVVSSVITGASNLKKIVFTNLLKHYINSMVIITITLLVLLILSKATYFQHWYGQKRHVLPTDCSWDALWMLFHQVIAMACLKCLHLLVWKSFVLSIINYNLLN